MATEKALDQQKLALKRKVTDLESLFDQQLALIELAIDALRNEMVEDLAGGALHESVVRRISTLSRSLETVGKTRVTVAGALKRLGEAMTHEERLEGAFKLLMSCTQQERANWTRRLALAHNEMKADNQPRLGGPSNLLPVTALQKMLEAVGDDKGS